MLRNSNIIWLYLGTETRLGSYNFSILTYWTYTEPGNFHVEPVCGYILWHHTKRHAYID